ncbi:hypothetical protein [Tritonibacter mobilis]|nr:hypothetical protein [Tritonibacter mobilis]MCA2009410.1 hypothetical protein [Tritonibacter mobilis]
MMQFRQVTGDLRNQPTRLASVVEHMNQRRARLLRGISYVLGWRSLPANP